MKTNAVFLKNQDNIFYLLSGAEGNMQGCKCEGFTVLDAAESEGAGEKHIPVLEKNGNRITVKVGSIAHPMTTEHSIDWIFLETRLGGQFIKLEPSRQPEGTFLLAEDDEAVAAYAYCNLHGFWKAEA